MTTKVNTSVDLSNAVDTVKLANPYFVSGSQMEFAPMAKGTSITASSFPSITSISPAVSTDTVSGAQTAVKAAAIAASVLPILAIGGCVAFSAALLTNAFRDRVVKKRLENFLNEFDEIESAIKTKNTKYSRMALEKYPEMKKVGLILQKLTDEFNELKCSISVDKNVLETGIKLCRAREIAENVKACERALAYLKLNKIAELEARSAEIGKVRSEIIENMSAIPLATMEITQLINDAHALKIERIPASEIDKIDIGRLSDIEEKNAAMEQAIGILSIRCVEIIDTQLIDNSIADKIKQVIKIEDICRVPRDHNTSEIEVNVVDRINVLLSELVFIEDCNEYADILKRFDDIKTEPDGDIRQLRYDDFVIFCEEILLKERRRIEPKNDLFEIQKQLECLETPNAMKLASELEKMIPSGGPVDMDSLKLKIISAVKEDSAQWEKDSYIRALIKAFEELGYEADENFEMVLINERKTYIHKPKMKDYHIEIMVSPDKKTVKTEVVREVEPGRLAEESSKNQETRDTEVQSEFSDDYEKVVKSLEKMGIKITEKIHEKPGEVKVQKVCGISDKKKKARRIVEDRLEKKI
ncbi:MAG: hypothetical protein A2008_00960 [Candidatus Wallbacteria bacterium GWC2_49_35]|uniref:Uncharacterized protein n=1 Tax=Candidatus Wallbacteria bacterium GWC2_49_35 TaxID=1817813 RepID=A0A1F7WTM2_9BACT|nr:MAG: hypothetical protein A2008_00960 [Candidatus Wallbacteria bacterium GWC2_49_35]HBC75656.1 hypothetical protein [Candidatus Wallbacteria bacterium]